MTLALAVALGLHQLAAIIWVGGMFFAHMVLRPAAHEGVKAPDRLLLMLGVFRRFFAWVWVSILLLWGTGLWVFLVPFGGKAATHIHLMTGIAAAMTVIFVFIYVLRYRGFRRAIQGQDWTRAGSALAAIRRLIAVNLVLGLITALAGSAGRYVLLG